MEYDLLLFLIFCYLIPIMTVFTLYLLEIFSKKAISDWIGFQLKNSIIIELNMENEIYFLINQYLNSSDLIN